MGLFPAKLGSSRHSQLVEVLVEPSGLDLLLRGVLGSPEGATCDPV